MKVTFYSNYLNHHQLPFCLAMEKRLGDNFRFVAATPTNPARYKLGYEDLNKKYSFVITTYDGDEEQIKTAIRLCGESDVVIHGSAPEAYVRERMKLNKLTFRYSERVLRKGRMRIFNLRTLGSMILHHTRYVNKKLYMLCASAYTAGDFALCGAYLGKAYKWGYFPEVKSYDISDLFAKKSKEVPVILWCARFIELKHPEVVVAAAQKLKEEGYSFRINMIGTGPLEDEMRSLINATGLENHVFLLGSMSPDKVREHMEQANIFLFTSDRREGWGAVLNEAMNSGCAVVANKAIGAVPFLVDNGKNGFLYKNFSNLYKKIRLLLDNPELQKSLGVNACNTMINQWNADVAAERLLELSKNLLEGRSCKDLYKNGPCSR